MDILNFPLYYISFNKNQQIEDHYKAFGFKDINHFQAVNGRKMDIKKLLEDNIISIRSYSDIMSGRVEHVGLTNLGAVGCTLSHYELWKKCIDMNYPYIIIAEDDNKMDRPLDKEDLQKISSLLEKKNSLVVSTKVNSLNDYKIQFIGLHFYIASQGACKELVKNCFPIDVQTDWYVSHIASQGKINVESYIISGQSKHASSIQEVCYMCIVNQQKKYLWIYLLLFIFMSYIIFKVFFCQNTQCKK